MVLLFYKVTSKTAIKASVIRAALEAQRATTVRLLLKKAKTFLYSMGNKYQIHQNCTLMMIELRPHPRQI